MLVGIGIGARGLIGCLVGSLVIAVGVSGCASDAASSPGSEGAAGSYGPPPSVLGGQTGALSVFCGLLPAAQQGVAVPAGDHGLVLYANECADATLSALELVGPTGELVDFALEELEGDASLLQPKGGLSPGRYTVQGPGLEPSSVEVAKAPTEFPRALGTLVPRPVGCQPDFDLAFADYAAAYAPLMRLEGAIDGGSAFTWFDYGRLSAPDGPAHVSLPLCFPVCLEDGPHMLTVTTHLAGYPDPLQPLTVPFDVSCNGHDPADLAAESSGAAAAGAPDGPGEQDGAEAFMMPGANRGDDRGRPSACHVGHAEIGSGDAPGWQASWPWIMAAALLGRRRRRRGHRRPPG